MNSTDLLRIRRAVPLALLLALTACGEAPEAPPPDKRTKHETALEHAKKHLDPTYVCPMHPQVLSSEPGECPICGMDLVAKEAEAAEADQQPAAGVDAVPAVTVSDAVVNQLGVRTAAVRRGTLTPNIEAFGVFVRSAGTSSLFVVAQVFEREAPLVRQGQTVRVRVPALGARELSGKVTTLDGQVNPTTHTLQFRVAASSEGVTIPGGMTAIVRVEVDPVTDVLLVPREAVIVTGKGARVVVAQGGGRFQPRPVEAEDLGEDEIVIRSGLNEGEQVVVSAQFLLDSEANLQAGLKRLSGGQTDTQSGAQPAAEGTLHEGHMHEGAMHEGAMHEGHTPEAAVPEGAPPGAAMQGPMPAAMSGAIREPVPAGAAHEGHMPPGTMNEGPNAAGAAQ